MNLYTRPFLCVCFIIRVWPPHEFVFKWDKEILECNIWLCETAFRFQTAVFTFWLRKTPQLRDLFDDNLLFADCMSQWFTVYSSSSPHCLFFLIINNMFVLLFVLAYLPSYRDHDHHLHHHRYHHHHHDR